MRWPRQTAATILQKRSREARNQMLMNVKPEFQAWVKFYVEDAWRRRKHVKR